MSHIPQRKEKDCLNCGAQVQGRYCHICGQENVVPKETFWHMVTHFFYDITHFDSSFFRTVRVLLFKPGFLSSEYINGRRASYLHPIRMYVFMSAIFFLFFFSFVDPISNEIKGLDEPITGKERELVTGKIEELTKKNSKDTSLINLLVLAKDTNRVITGRDVLRLEKDSNVLQVSGIHYKNVRDYDSVQQSLPSKKKDNWLERRVIRKVLEINEKYKGNKQEALEKLVENLFHRFPYLLLISLPFFALLLKIVYFRRKNYYYADHGVFTIHLYVFTFIALLVGFAVDEMQKKWGGSWQGTVQIALIFTLYFYLYKAMRRFYRQKRFKTFVKLLIIALFSFIMMLVLLGIIFLFTAYQL